MTQAAELLLDLNIEVQLVASRNEPNPRALHALACNHGGSLNIVVFRIESVRELGRTGKRFDGRVTNILSELSLRLYPLERNRGRDRTRTCDLLRRALSSRGAKSVIFANSEAGCVTIHVTKIGYTALRYSLE